MKNEPDMLEEYDFSGGIRGKYAKQYAEGDNGGIMKEIVESYRPIGDSDDCFDIRFWQSQGSEAIFKAALDMILDYQILRDGHADEPRLQRTIEYYGKIEGPSSQPSLSDHKMQ